LSSHSWRDRASDYADCGSTWQAIAQMKPIISRDCGGNNHCLFACSDKAAISRAETHLRLPSGIPDAFWQTLDTIVQLSADPRLHAVGPGSLNQRPASLTIPGFRDAAPSHAVAA